MASAAASAPNTLLSGAINKQGARLKAWNKRYATLTLEGLSLWASADAREVKSFIPAQGTVVEPQGKTAIVLRGAAGVTVLGAADGGPVLAAWFEMLGRWALPRKIPKRPAPGTLPPLLLGQSAANVEAIRNAFGALGQSF